MKTITEVKIRQVVREELQEVLGLDRLINRVRGSTDAKTTRGAPLNLSTRSVAPSQEERETFIQNILQRVKKDPMLAHKLVQSVSVGKSKPMGSDPKISTLNFATVLNDASKFFDDEQQKDQVMRYINTYGNTLQSVVEEIANRIENDEELALIIRSIRESKKLKR